MNHELMAGFIVGMCIGLIGVWGIVQYRWVEK